MNRHQYHDVFMRGTLERITYATTNREGEPRDKYANVYLPHGYDAANKEKKYNILYVMHGGGGNPDSWLDCCKVKNMLDYAIDRGEVQPLIVVFPSYYKEKVPRVGAPDAEREKNNVILFQDELVEELLPAVESAYHTYAEDVTKEALIASRMHRGISGFSMGGCTTWFAFINHLDYFSEFVPLSGDCWAIEVMGGLSKPVETVKVLRDSAVKSGYGADEFFIRVATGTKDAASEPLTMQVNEMKKYPEVFVYNDDLTQGNLHFLHEKDEVHSYESVYQFLYHFLPYLFKANEKS